MELVQSEHRLCNRLSRALRNRLLIRPLQQLEDLGLLAPNSNLPITPINNLYRLASTSPLLPHTPKAKLTTGVRKLSLSILNLLSASLTLLAPLTICGISPLPTYPSIVSTWSAVGDFSQMSRSKGSRATGAAAEVGDAAGAPVEGASLAAWEALVAACLRRLMARVEAGVLALWKRVIMSRVLRWGG